MIGLPKPAVITAVVTAGLIAMGAMTASPNYAISVIDHALRPWCGYGENAR
ncbi:hypothetical protein ACQP25_36315 [Microtetraspora malaysiensis]|uniref:hypothetical protein n=1 Tax=Microtetraspora malaysiensis TaxID=161358 RepID=UPI003D92456D